MRPLRTGAGWSSDPCAPQSVVRNRAAGFDPLSWRGLDLGSGELVTALQMLDAIAVLELVTTVLQPVVLSLLLQMRTWFERALSAVKSIRSRYKSDY